MSTKLCTNIHISKNHLVQLLIICSVFNISKPLTPSFFTVELYGMIAYAAQGNRNGHKELQYQSIKSIN